MRKQEPQCSKFYLAYHEPLLSVLCVAVEVWLWKRTV